jgi:hypothetical protein
VAHQGVGRLEDRRADQDLQLLHQHAGGRLRLEARDQLLDFLFLRQEEVGRGPGFSFEPTPANC